MGVILEIIKIIIIVFVGLLILMAFIGGIWHSKKEKLLQKSPEQQEQVEVGGKRKIVLRDRKNNIYTFKYFVTFKFSDGSEKEFNIGEDYRAPAYTGRHTDDTNKEFYEAIQEGDTGILTFKEGNDKCRAFIHFENDFSNHNEQAEVIEKRTEENADDQTISYFITFQCYDGSKKEFLVPKEAYESIQLKSVKGIVYKERKDIEEHSIDEKSRWKDRRFISFGSVDADWDEQTDRSC